MSGQREKCMAWLPICSLLHWLFLTKEWNQVLRRKDRMRSSAKGGEKPKHSKREFLFQIELLI